MKRLLTALIAGCALAAPVAGQSNVETGIGETVTLRALDTLTGIVQDINVSVGETAEYERLTIRVDECRYPLANQMSDAFAYLVIQDVREDVPRFEGWMVASSPALSALEHPRYDVWVLACISSETTSDPEANAEDG